ncbi:retrovirus-related pol polyprotein from transposon TNT 1-94, partial [Tanacetum coccineum]
MYTEEDSDRYIAQCFVNGLYASDGEINLEKNENLISNDYAVKLCLEYEVRKGKKLVKKELMVLLRGEIYFVQFIINPKEDEFEPGLIFGRSFLRSAKGIVNFMEGTITIQPDFDPFLLSIDEERNPNLDNLEMLLDFDDDEEPQTETDLPQLVCKMGKGSRNKKKVMENIMYFNNSARPSSSYGTPLTQEEAERRTLAYRISMRLEGRINENALADTGSDTNTIPYRIYEQLGRDDIMKEERNITMINYTEAEVTGRLVNVLCQVGFTTLSAKFLILEIHVDRDAPNVVGHGFLDIIG